MSLSKELLDDSYREVRTPFFGVLLKFQGLLEENKKVKPKKESSSPEIRIEFSFGKPCESGQMVCSAVFQQHQSQEKEWPAETEIKILQGLGARRIRVTCKMEADALRELGVEWAFPLLEEKKKRNWKVSVTNVVRFTPEGLEISQRRGIFKTKRGGMQKGLTEKRTFYPFSSPWIELLRKRKRISINRFGSSEALTLKASIGESLLTLFREDPNSIISEEAIELVAKFPPFPKQIGPSFLSEFLKKSSSLLETFLQKASASSEPFFSPPVSLNSLLLWLENELGLGMPS